MTDRCFLHDFTVVAYCTKVITNFKMMILYKFKIVIIQRSMFGSGFPDSKNGSEYQTHAWLLCHFPRIRLCHETMLCCSILKFREDIREDDNAGFDEYSDACQQGPRNHVYGRLGNVNPDGQHSNRKEVVEEYHRLSNDSAIATLPLAAKSEYRA